MSTSIYAIALVILATMVGAWGAYFLKIGAPSLLLNFKGTLGNTKIVAGIFLYLLSSVFYVIALRKGQLTILYPFCGFGYIWVTIISALFLGEKVNRYKIMAVMLIVLGIALVGIGDLP